MTKRLPFTEASIRRAVNGARKAGLRVVGIAADGTLLVEDGGTGIAPDLAASQTTLPPPDAEVWGDVEA